MQSNRKRKKSNNAALKKIQKKVRTIKNHTDALIQMVETLF